MTTLEVLQKARSFISDPLKWTTDWGHMNQKGEGYTCAVGAVRTAVGLCSSPLGDNDVLSGNKEADSAVKKLGAVIGEHTPFAVVRYNDHHSHECVIAMFDAAIEQEQAK